MSFTYDLNKIQQKIKEDNEKKNNNDYYGDYWRLPTKNNFGLAKIRFLPFPDIESIPVLKKREHKFKIYNGEYYKYSYLQGIEFSVFCPSSIGLPCPICEMNKPNWKINKDKASILSAKWKYYSNILVISEPKEFGNPENYGKVKKFVFGQQIYKILENAINPSEDDLNMGKEPIYYFLPDNLGCDFILKCEPKGEYPDYTSSEFAKKCSPILKDTHHRDFEEIYKDIFSPKDLFNDEIIKSYEEIMELFSKAKEDSYMTVDNKKGSEKEYESSLEKENKMKKDNDSNKKYYKNEKSDDEYKDDLQDLIKEFDED